MHRNASDLGVLGYMYGVHVCQYQHDLVVCLKLGSNKLSRMTIIRGLSACHLHVLDGPHAGGVFRQLNTLYDIDSDQQMPVSRHSMLVHSDI